MSADISFDRSSPRGVPAATLASSRISIRIGPDRGYHQVMDMNGGDAAKFI